MVLILADAGVIERAVRVKMLASEPAVANGATNVNSEHLKSASCVSQLATNRFLLVLPAATLSEFRVEAEFAVVVITFQANLSIFDTANPSGF